MDRCCARGRTCERNTGTGCACCFGGFTLATAAECFDYCGFHGKLNEVEREEPDDVPHPDDPDPPARDGSDVREAPVGIGGDDG